MTPRLERRSHHGGLRLASGTGGTQGNRVTGHAAMFNIVTDLGDMHEVVRPGAFSRTLRERAINVTALFNHNSDHVLARSASGTLRLKEDSRGLHFELDLPNTTTANDVRELMRRGDLGECSFAFAVVPGGERYTRDGGVVLRELLDVDLYDVSIVAMPAYSGTSAQLASARPRTVTQLLHEQLEQNDRFFTSVVLAPIRRAA